MAQENGSREIVALEQVERLKAGEGLRVDAPTRDGRTSFELTVLPIRNPRTGRVVRLMVTRRD